MPKRSAALLLYRQEHRDRPAEVLLVHPGGPFWARKDTGSWSIPKGEYGDGEEPLAAARREFQEEVGIPPPPGDAVELGTIKQPSGKLVVAFALRGEVDLTDFHSNTFEMEWPKGSGRLRTFPEVDKVAWFSLDVAHTKLLKGQLGFLDLLAKELH
jgi:predicted NUDIX family NTP pyrophosphohydrolase